MLIAPVLALGLPCLNNLQEAHINTGRKFRLADRSCSGRCPVDVSSSGDALKGIVEVSSIRVPRKLG